MAGSRVLADDIGSAEQYQEQLYSISHRSEGDWTVTVTHLALALNERSQSCAGRSSVVQSWQRLTARGQLPSGPSVPITIHSRSRVVSDAGLGEPAGTEGDKSVSTSALRHLGPAVDAKKAKPHRVGLIAARSKAEAQGLSANVARALETAGADVIREENLASAGAWASRRDRCAWR